MNFQIAYVKIKYFSILAALPGAQHLERCFDLARNDLYDSESLSALKINMGAWAISCLGVTDYL